MDIPRTREEAEDSIENISEQIKSGINAGKFKFAELQDAVLSKTRDAAESTDKMVRDNPWAAIGIAAGLGLVIGLLLPRGD